MKIHGISSSSPTVLPAAERREGERSQTDRSTAAGKTVAPAPPTAPRPDPEVVADARRRIFTAEYKLRILAEADAAAGRAGAIGALLRRESLYSSLLTTWRRERQAGILKGLTPLKRGPKSKRNPQEEEIQKLRRENQRLTEELRKGCDPRSRLDCLGRSARRHRLRRARCLERLGADRPDGVGSPLRSRGALVAFLEWDPMRGKGIDDHLAAVGPETALDEMTRVDFAGTAKDLLRSKPPMNNNAEGRILPVLANAIASFHHAPEWGGVMAFNEFAFGTVA